MKQSQHLGGRPLYSFKDITVPSLWKKLRLRVFPIANISLLATVAAFRIIPCHFVSLDKINKIKWISILQATSDLDGHMYSSIYNVFD